MRPFPCEGSTVAARLVAACGALHATLSLNRVIDPRTPGNAIIGHFVSNDVAARGQMSCCHFILRGPTALHVRPRGFAHRIRFQLVRSTGTGCHVTDNSVVLRHGGDSTTPLRVSNLKIKICCLRIAKVSRTTTGCDLGLSTAIKTTELPIDGLNGALGSPVLVIKRLGNGQTFRGDLSDILRTARVCRFALARTIQLETILDSIGTRTRLCLCQTIVNNARFDRRRRITATVDGNVIPYRLDRSVLIPKACCLQMVGHSKRQLSCGLRLRTAPMLDTQVQIGVRRLHTLTVFSTQIPFAG